MLADLNYTFYFFFGLTGKPPLFKADGVFDSKQFIIFSLSPSLRSNLTLVVGKATEMGGQSSGAIVVFDFLVF